MITALQVAFVLLLIVIIILFVYRPKKKEGFMLPEHYPALLLDYIPFYERLNEEGRRNFLERFRKFLSSVRITGVNAQVEDLDRVLIAAGAIIPVYHIPDWEYINLHEVLVYPGSFNTDFDQQGHQRTISGMVGTGYMQNVMILSKWELRQGFIDRGTHRNVAIHEFVHLVDKMDGTLDGIPELLLERRYIPRWKELIATAIDDIRHGRSDLDPYAATSPVECFAVMSEYFFEHPEYFRNRYPELDELMRRIFFRAV